MACVLGPERRELLGRVETVADDLAAARRLQGDHQPALEQGIDDGLEGREVGDGLHAGRAGAQLPERLGAPEHQLGQHRQLGLADTQPLVGVVLVLGGPAEPVDLAHRTQRAQLVERLLDAEVVVGGDRVAVVLLVASGDDRVDRHRITGRRGLGLLDQHAEHPPLAGVERLPGGRGAGAALRRIAHVPHSTPATPSESARADSASSVNAARARASRSNATARDRSPPRSRIRAA